MRKGFGLLEMLVTISIMGLVIGAGMFSYSRTTRVQTLNAAADKLKQAFQLAKSNALSGKKICSECGGCSNTDSDEALTRWTVEVQPGAKQFRVNGWCGGTNFTQVTQWASLNMRSTATLVVAPGSVANVGFKPLNQGVVYNGTNALVSPNVITYTLNDPGVTTSRTVRINADGSID